MRGERAPLAEWLCLALFLVYLLWLPMPFGSATDDAQLPLVAGALAVCALTAAVAALTRMPVSIVAAARVWSIGAVVFIAVVALQLVPLPRALLRVVSPESARIWSAAARVSSLMSSGGSPLHPITIDPPATWLHLFRLVTYLAIFTTALLLLRRHTQRLIFAVTLACGALFETIYGAREVALGRFAIWGWRNTLIFGRATGTFVNPNHFAHYVALALPMGAFVAAMAWHDAAPPGASLRRRVAKLVERRLLGAAFGAVTVVACIASILVARSRGALLATLAGCAIAVASATHRRAARVSLTVGAVLAIVLAVALYIGADRTAVGRFAPSSTEIQDLGGRRTGLITAAAILRRFPLLGSGLGTFVDVAPMAQPPSLTNVFNHAHDDYAEIAATTGIIGFAAFLVPLAIGLTRLVRSESGSWRRNAFHVAALASIATALVHALVDFNFFIPANAATLAAIAGAAVATRPEPTASRDSASADSPA